MRAWWVWFIACFAFGWMLRSLGSSVAARSEIRSRVRELEDSALDMEKRVRKLEGREPGAH